MQQKHISINFKRELIYIYHIVEIFIYIVFDKKNIQTLTITKIYNDIRIQKWVNYIQMNCHIMYRLTSLNYMA